jgi:L-iditol 2-dehydrogenase
MVRVPEDVTFEEATFVEPVNTCLKAVEKAGVGAEQTVLVVGQGQIGLLFTQLARAADATVLASDPLPFRRECAERFGARETYDPTTDVPAAVRQATEGRGADLAIVAVADNCVVAQAFEAVRPGGKVLLFAQTRLGDPLSVDAGAVCMLEKDLIGSYSADIDVQEKAAALIFRRAINVRDLITDCYPLSAIQSAIERAARPQSHSLKVLVRP